MKTDMIQKTACGILYRQVVKAVKKMTYKGKIIEIMSDT